MVNSTVTPIEFNAAQESKQCMMLAKRVAFFEWTKLPMNLKISVVLRLTFVCVCLVMVFGNKPPMSGQTHGYISTTDAARDVSIAQLSEFKSNQQAINIETQSILKELAARQSASEAEIQSIEGWEKGGFGVLTALSILAMFFQLKKKG